MRRLHPGRLSDLDIEADLMPPDRVFQRWARAIAGRPICRKCKAEKSHCVCARPEWADAPGSQVPELPTDAAIWVDRYVCSRPERMRKFLHSWYRGQDASAVIAKRFNVGRNEVYALWRATLIVARADFLKEPSVASLMVKQQEAA